MDFTDREVKYIYDAHKRGLSRKQIAAQLNRPSITVSDKLDELQLKTNRGDEIEHIKEVLCRTKSLRISANILKQPYNVLNKLSKKANADTLYIGYDSPEERQEAMAWIIARELNPTKEDNEREVLRQKYRELIKGT